MNFVPRLNDNGILNNPKWYSNNPFYQSNYGMPNCTCYAWGRFWEESNDDSSSMDNRPDNLPTGDGGVWFDRAVQSGYYETGQIPKLGAVICFEDNNGGSGHVAIVEEINETTGEITCSNSAWQGTYFFLTNITPSGGRYDWSHYTFQGFIYNPFIIEPTPPTPTRKKKGFPWAIYARKFRNRRLTL